MGRWTVPHPVYQWCVTPALQNTVLPVIAVRHLCLCWKSFICWNGNGFWRQLGNQSDIWIPEKSHHRCTIFQVELYHVLLLPYLSSSDQIGKSSIHGEVHMYAHRIYRLPLGHQIIWISYWCQALVLHVLPVAFFALSSFDPANLRWHVLCHFAMFSTSSFDSNSCMLNSTDVGNSPSMLNPLTWFKNVWYTSCALPCKLLAVHFSSPPSPHIMHLDQSFYHHLVHHHISISVVIYSRNGSY